MKKPRHNNHSNPLEDGPLVPIARCRELLGDASDSFSDEAVEELRHHAEVMARVLIEMYLATRPPRPS